MVLSILDKFGGESSQNRWICPGRFNWRIVTWRQAGYRCEMFRRYFKNWPALIAGVIFLTACETEQPYVFKEGEFDRSSPEFNKKPDDMDQVRICYNRRATTPEALLAMARKECGLYGKRALFQKHEFLQCPIATPARVTFQCLKP